MTRPRKPTVAQVRQIRAEFAREIVQMIEHMRSETDRVVGPHPDTDYLRGRYAALTIVRDMTRILGSA